MKLLAPRTCRKSYDPHPQSGATTTRSIANSRRLSVHLSLKALHKAAQDGRHVSAFQPHLNQCKPSLPSRPLPERCATVLVFALQCRGHPRALRAGQTARKPFRCSVRAERTLATFPIGCCSRAPQWDLGHSAGNGQSPARSSERHRHRPAPAVAARWLLATQSNPVPQIPWLRSRPVQRRHRRGCRLSRRDCRPCRTPRETRCAGSRSR